jgi:WD40 repeat protein
MKEPTMNHKHEDDPGRGAADPLRPDDEPVVYAVHREASGWKLTRRGLVAAAGTLAAACGPGAKSGIDCGGARAHMIAVSGLAISGRTLISAADGDGLKLWALPEGALTGHIEVPGSVFGPVIQPRSGLLAYGSSASEIRFQSIPGGAVARKIPTAFVNPFTMSPDGDLVAAAGLGNVSVWSAQSGGLIVSIRAADPAPEAIAFGMGGKLLLGGFGSEIRVWALPSGQFVQVMGHPGPVSVLLASQDGQQLTSAGGKSIHQWNLADGTMQRTLDGHTADVRCLAQSRDGKVLVSGDAEGQVRIWSAAEIPAVVLNAHEKSSVRSLAISDDGTLLASGAADGTLKLWSLPKGDALSCLMDVGASPSDSKGIRYVAKGDTAVRTISCGSSLPPGAVCTCNCVAGAICSCVSVCSCVSNTCSCVSNSSSGYSSGSHYWRPN